MFKVRFEPCDQCLFSKNKIVPNAKRKQILQDCRRRDCHFICHKSTANGKEVCCRSFYDLPDGTNLIRIAERLGVVVFTDDMGKPVEMAEAGRKALEE